MSYYSRRRMQAESADYCKRMQEENAGPLKVYSEEETKDWDDNHSFDSRMKKMAQNKGYYNYVAKNGYHFTDELADYVTKKMVNRNGKEHNWSSAQVAGAVNMWGISFPDTVSSGDVSYIVNMAYADFSLPDADCFEYARKVATDPDGCEGMIFCRFVADCACKGMIIPWEDFV